MIKKLVTITAVTLLLSGCLFPKLVVIRGESPYREKSFDLKVETKPSGYLVGVSEYPNPRDDQIKVLGISDMNFWGFSVVKRTFKNGDQNYWLRNVSGVVPSNSKKPQWASDEYDAGRGYPHSVYVMVLREQRNKKAVLVPSAKVEFNEEILRMIFENDINKVIVTLDIDRGYSAVHYFNGDE